MGTIDEIAAKAAAAMKSGSAVQAEKGPQTPPDVAPEMQAAIDENAKNQANPKEAQPVNATAAGTMGLPAQVPEVQPTDAEIAAATTPPDPTTGRGYAEPGLSLTDPSAKPPAAPPATPPVSTPTKVADTKQLPLVGNQAPTTKQMIANVLYNSGTAPVEGKPIANSGVSNFGDLLKGASGKLGDFLQRWGMGLQGAPTGMTQGDIQRQQAFELKKQEMQAQVMARQQAMDNQYATQRMQLQNQMNMANLPIEKKAELQNQMAMLDAQYQNELKMLPLRIQQEFAMRGMQPGADPMLSWSGGK